MSASCASRNSYHLKNRGHFRTMHLSIGIQDTTREISENSLLFYSFMSTDVNQKTPSDIVNSGAYEPVVGQGSLDRTMSALGTQDLQ